MIDINCDVGEGLDNEHLLMPYISSCNIACGGHAGDLSTMRKVVALADEHDVKIGAHPSYPDPENFGRNTMQLSSGKLSKTINDQIQSLLKVVSDAGSKLHHIKPHGALYNDLAKNMSLAKIFLNAIEGYREHYALYVPFGSAIEKEALRRNFKIIYEAFADRNYSDDLSLVSRQNSDALLTNPEQIVKHISLMRGGQVKTISGKKVPIKADTFCVHSDTSDATDIVKKIHDVFSNI